MADYTVPKGTPTFSPELSTGAHYYAFSPTIKTYEYTQAYAEIQLPTSFNNVPASNVGATYPRRNAYISLGIWSPIGGVDLGITNQGQGWCPCSCDTADTDKTRKYKMYTSYAAPTATKAYIYVKPINSVTVHMYVQFLNASGTTVKTFDQDITVINHAEWTAFYRFASLCQTTGSDIRNDGTYMKGGKLSNLGLYNYDKKGYVQWGISTNLIKDYWIVHPSDCAVTPAVNSETFEIWHKYA